MGVMAAFIRESVAHDSDEDGDRITLSLGTLDTELSDAEEYSENPSPAKRDRKSSTLKSPTPRRTPTPRDHPHQKDVYEKAQGGQHVVLNT